MGWRMVGVPYTSMRLPGGIARAIEVLRSRDLAVRLARLGVADAGDLRLQDPAGVRGASGLLNEAALAELVEATREATLRARRQGGRILLVGGDCPVMLGALAALREHAEAPVGLVMLDGHEDAWLPSQSPTGEASDSELGIALGLVSESLPAPLDRLVPLLNPADVALLGPRDRAEIEAAGGRSLRGQVGLYLDADESRQAENPGGSALHQLDVSEFWLHVDLDVLATDAF
jgi:arginase